MKPRSLDLLSLGGTRVAVDWSWLLVFSLVTASLALGYLPGRHPGHGVLAYWTVAVVVALLFFASILVHELAHAWVSSHLGVRVERITLFVFGGLARLESEPRDPATDFKIAVAGPLASLWLGAVLGLAALALGGGDPPALWLAALQYLALVNVALALFNSLPGLPLDGGRVLRSLLWKRTGDFDAATRRASDWGRGLGVGIAALGLLVVALGDLLGGLWLMLIGMFIRGAAGATQSAVLVDRALRRTCVRDLMVERPVVVNAGALVADVLDGYFLRHGFGGYPVVGEEGVVGLLSLAEIKQCPRDERTRRIAAEIMRPADEAVRIAPDAALGAALRQMRDSGSTRLLVMEEGRLVGLVTQTGIVRVLGLRMQLE
jgi:Zn-dependent protease